MLGLVELNGPVFLVEWASGGELPDVLKIWTFRPVDPKHFALDGISYDHFELAEIVHDSPILSEEGEAAISDAIRSGKYYEVADLDTALYGEDEARQIRAERRVDEIRQEGV